MLLRLSGMGVQLTAMAARRLLRGVLPVAVLLVAASALVWLNAYLTFILAPLGLIYLVPLYLVNRHAARIHLKFSRTNPAMNARLHTLFRDTIDQGDEPDRHRLRLDRALASPAFEEASTTFHQRRMVEDTMKVVNTSFAVVAILALFVYGAWAHGRGENLSWTAIFAYLLALRFAIGAASQVTGTLASVSRFMPEFERYAHFIETAVELGSRDYSAPDHGTRTDAEDI